MLSQGMLIYCARRSGPSLSPHRLPTLLGATFCLPGASGSAAKVVLEGCDRAQGEGGIVAAALAVAEDPTNKPFRAEEVFNRLFAAPEALRVHGAA